MVHWLAEVASRRRALRDARYRSALATEEAKAVLAPYRAKAEIEWDLRWTSPLDKSWRDEALIFLWSLPLVGLLLPWSREYIVQVFELLKGLDPSAPSFFLWGWAVIFITTFGINQTKRLFWPGRMAGLVRAMGEVRDDVPDEAMEGALDNDYRHNDTTSTPYYPRRLIE